MRAGMPVQRALNRTSADLWAEIAAAADVDFGYHQNGWLRLFTSGEGLAAAAEEVAQAASLGVDGEVLDAGRVRELVIGKVDGDDVSPGSPWRDRLFAAGFAAGYRGMALRAGTTRDR